MWHYYCCAKTSRSWLTRLCLISETTCSMAILDRMDLNFCNLGKTRPQLDIAVLILRKARLLPPEKRGQCGVDWDSCPKECMLGEQLHLTVGQVAAPELLKQDLNTEHDQARLLCLQGKTVTEHNSWLKAEGVVCLHPLPGKKKPSVSSSSRCSNY